MMPIEATIIRVDGAVSEIEPIEGHLAIRRAPIGTRWRVEIAARLPHAKRNTTRWRVSDIVVTKRGDEAFAFSADPACDLVRLVLVPAGSDGGGVAPGLPSSGSGSFSQTSTDTKGNQ